MTEFFSSAILSQRVKELESCTKRKTDELAELVTVMARVEKRSQWLQKRIRAQRRRKSATEHGLALARCYVEAAQIREYVASWVVKHRADSGAPPSFAELERNLGTRVGALIEVVEQHLKARAEDAHELHASPLSGSASERASEEPDDDEAGGLLQEI